jgi:hypothetical protein
MAYLVLNAELFSYSIVSLLYFYPDLLPANPKGKRLVSQLKLTGTGISQACKHTAPFSSL